MAREDQPLRPEGGGTLVVYGGRSLCSDLSTFLSLGMRSWRSKLFWSLRHDLEDGTRVRKECQESRERERWVVARKPSLCPISHVGFLVLSRYVGVNVFQIGDISSQDHHRSGVVLFTQHSCCPASVR